MLGKIIIERLYKIKLKDSKNMIGILGDNKDDGGEKKTFELIEKKCLGKGIRSSDGVCMESATQHENKTPESYEIKGKEKILNAFMEKRIFYKGTRTKELLEVLSAKFYVRT